MNDEPQFDVCFFINGVPIGFAAHCERWVLAKIADSGSKIVRELTDQNLRFKFFIEDNGLLAPMAFIWRGPGSGIKTAIENAFAQVELLLDGYSLLADRPLRVAELIMARSVGDTDANLYEYHRGGYAYLQEKNDPGSGQWLSRNYTVIQMVLKYFDFTEEQSVAAPSEVKEHVEFALRMYRQGAETKFHGIEFLAKFSALECLVCGTSTTKKEEMLRVRLAELFDEYGTEFVGRISKLWRLRCAGSHQARVSDDKGSDEMPPGVACIYVEQIFAGVLYFILENIDGCHTFDQLWAKASDYVIPEIVKLHRPSGSTQMAVTDLLAGPIGSVVNASLLFDHVQRQLKGKSESR